jgi:CxxC motif-containing protein
VAAREKVICVGCPMGCLINIIVDNGVITAIEGNRCKQGEKYANEEYRNPVRTLTTTLLTQESSQPLLPVRTSKPVHRQKMLSIVTALAGVSVRPPVRIGEVVVSQPEGVMVDVIATADMLD